MSRVLITGAGGYIGSVLTRMLLEAGHTVTAVDVFYFGRETLPAETAQLRVVQQDICALEPAAFRRIDAVIDLAALSNDPAGELDVRRTFAVNHAGRVRVATLAKRARVRRYILPSSCSVYGFQDGLLNEASPVNPLTAYAQANYQAERDTLALADDRFTVVVIRQATVYGWSLRMRFDLAINGMVRGLFKDRRIPILRDGTQWRPFVHVRDTSSAMVGLLEAPARAVNGEIFNVGTDRQNHQILPLARTIAQAVGIRFEYEWYGLPDHRSYRVSFEKVRRVLGFSARFTPADGAREIFDALTRGVLDPDDPRTITVSWYKHLLGREIAASV